jgi:CRP-like cAMP-binding protein
MQESFVINSDYKRSLLNSLDLFKGVYPNDIQSLLQRCDRRDLEEGEHLLSPREKNEHVFIVLSGSLNIHVGSPKAPILATMEAGECVGEMSIIEDRDPSAYVIAAENTHLLLIHQSVLWDMVDASHEFAKNLLVVLSERVRSHNRVIADSYGELRKFERHATTDALTSLANRHAMELPAIAHSPQFRISCDRNSVHATSSSVMAVMSSRPCFRTLMHNRL